MQKIFVGGEAARLHYVILLFPIEVTHSSWIFFGGGGGGGRSWRFWGAKLPPPPLDETLAANNSCSHTRVAGAMNFFCMILQNFMCL